MSKSQQIYSNTVGGIKDTLAEVAVTTSFGVVTKKLKEFGSLQPGWSFGEGRSFGPDTIRVAQSLAEHAAGLRLFEIDAVPGLEGEVHLCLYRGNIFADLAIRDNQSIDFRSEVCHAAIENCSASGAQNLFDKHQDAGWESPEFKMCEGSGQEQLFHPDAIPKLCGEIEQK